MRKLLERSVESIDQRLVLLAPPHMNVPECFDNVSVDPSRHDQLLRRVQAVRGTIYLRDGAIRHDQLSSEGLHRTVEDGRSWHLVMVNPDGEVSSCAWYMEHEDTAGFESLRVRHSPLSRDKEWGHRLWLAVESELERARREQLRYAEIGGWAVSEKCRCTSEGLVLALIWYSLGQTRGDALGMTTATVRHSSSTILRRLGGQDLEYDGVAIPSYFDPRYGCEMELLRFDSRRPNPKYAELIRIIGETITSATVIAKRANTYADAVAAAPQPQPLFAA
jgi:hypothetical protein